MRKLKIHEITCYGEYYSSHNYTIKPIYWLRLRDYKILDAELLIEKGKIKSVEQLRDTGKYIPVFQTDMIALYKDFVQQFCPDVHQKLCDIEKSNAEFNYGTAFRIFFNGNVIQEMWYVYEDYKLKKDAIQWCQENGLSFVL